MKIMVTRIHSPMSYAFLEADYLTIDSDGECIVYSHDTDGKPYHQKFDQESFMIICERNCDIKTWYARYHSGREAMAKYLFDDEDNAPMNEENMQNKFENNPPRPDRDCPNCRYKMPNGDCTQWDCNFAPKKYVIEEVKEWLEKERTRRE